MSSLRYFGAHREQTKQNKCSEAARIAGAKFYSLVLETLGTMGPSLSFKKFLRKAQSKFFKNVNNSGLDLEKEV